MIQASAVWHAEPEILAAWGSFGAIFTAIAVAHTLYAPREVVLWNWRRIVLLAVSIAIAVGSQFSMIIVVPLALAFLLYLAPIRRGAALIIWTAATLLAASSSLRHLFLPSPRLPPRNAARLFLGGNLAQLHRPRRLQSSRPRNLARLSRPRHAPASSDATYFLWPRTRYFGNTAPGLIALLFVALGIAHPDLAGQGFLLASIPFILIFVSGILADLMETPYRMLVTPSVVGLLLADILWTLHKLSQIPQG